MARANFTVQINYKSGKSVEVECDDLSVKVSAEGNLVSVSWVNITPKPIAVGINEIESIYQIRP